MEVVALIADAVTVIISLFALYVAVRQTRIQREHNLATMAPHLGYVSARNVSPGSESIAMTLKNVGGGPAKITSFVFGVMGKRYVFPKGLEMKHILTHMGVQGTVEDYLMHPGEMIGAGERIQLLSIKAANRGDIPEAISSIKWEITYESIYGERQTVVFP